MLMKKQLLKICFAAGTGSAIIATALITSLCWIVVMKLGQLRIKVCLHLLFGDIYLFIKQ